MKSKNWIAALLFVLPAILLGLGGYTFYYAKGYSYLLDDPKACVNCHVMRENYRAWEIAEHRFVSCNGCHVPQDNFVHKYAVKAEHGLRHSYVFTFGDPQVIRLKKSGESVVENNCIRCHATTLSTIFHDPESGGHRCFDCHRGVGHKF